MALLINGAERLFQTREEALRALKERPLKARQLSAAEYLDAAGELQVMLGYGTNRDVKVAVLGDYDTRYAPIVHTHLYAGSKTVGGPANSVQNPLNIVFDGATPGKFFNGETTVVLIIWLITKF